MDGHECVYVDMAIYSLLSHILPSTRSLLFGRLFQGSINTFFASGLVSLENIFGFLSANVTAIIAENINFPISFIENRSI